MHLYTLSFAIFGVLNFSFSVLIFAFVIVLFVLLREGKSMKLGEQGGGEDSERVRGGKNRIPIECTNKFENNCWIPAFSSLDMLPEAGFPVGFFFPSGNTVYVPSDYSILHPHHQCIELQFVSIFINTYHFKDFCSISLHFV